MATTHRMDPPSAPGPQASGPQASNLLDRQPPCNLQAEMAVLGSIVLRPDVCDEVVMVLRPDDFYDDAHRKLFEHMLEMHDAGRKIDVPLLVENLKRGGVYETFTSLSMRTGQAIPCDIHPLSADPGPGVVHKGPLSFCVLATNIVFLRLRSGTQKPFGILRPV